MAPLIVGVVVGSFAIALLLVRRHREGRGPHPPTFGAHAFNNKPATPDGVTDVELAQFRRLRSIRQYLESRAALARGLAVEQSEPPEDDSSSGSGSEGAPAEALMYATTLPRRRPPGRPDRS